MIVVHIDMAEVSKNPLLENPIQMGCYILKRLKAKGIPVTGLLFPTGVAFGRLTTYDDDDLGVKVYEWVQED